MIPAQDSQTITIMELRTDYPRSLLIGVYMLCFHRHQRLEPYDNMRRAHMWEGMQIDSCIIPIPGGLRELQIKFSKLNNSQLKFETPNAARDIIRQGCGHSERSISCAFDTQFSHDEVTTPGPAAINQSPSFYQETFQKHWHFVLNVQNGTLRYHASTLTL